VARLLILDSEGVNALAHPDERGVASIRASAITRRARTDHAAIVIPLVVLAEVYRGIGSDVKIDRLVRSLDRIPATLGLTRLAGALRARAGRGSAVDAIVVATAIRLGGALIATADPEDLSALAANHSNVKVWSL
jgi:predicted nucleic acid-binding protein